MSGDHESEFSDLTYTLAVIPNNISLPLNLVKEPVLGRSIECEYSREVPRLLYQHE